MSMHISALTLIVPDYDQALDFYIDCLGFHLVEDTTLSATKRWVVVAPTTSCKTHILLAQAADKKQESSIGNQAGGRVFLFLETDNFQQEFARLKDNGVHFLEEPRIEPYGTVTVFQDPFGNKWDLIERMSPAV